MSEKEKILVSKLKNDDKIAFQKLFKLYSERIYYFSIRYLKNSEDAEEITQEVFVRLWNRRFNLKPELSFSSYLFMIAKNAVIDLLRKRKKEAAFNESFTLNTKAPIHEDNKSIEFKELNDIVIKSIDDLPLRRKQIFLMSREEGLTYKQIAEKLSISIKTVESHMRLSLQQLRKFIGENYELIFIGIFFITLLY